MPVRQILAASPSLCQIPRFRACYEGCNLHVRESPLHALYESAEEADSLFSLQFSSQEQSTKLLPYLINLINCRFSLQQNHICQRKVSLIPIKSPCHRHVTHFRQLARLTKHLLLDGSLPKSRNRSQFTVEKGPSVPSDGFTALSQCAISIPVLSPSLGATTELPAHPPREVRPYLPVDYSW